MSRAARQPGPDLFAAAALAEAERAAVAAELERQKAARRYQFAPHGERETRQAALQEAAQAALRTDIALTRARREAGL
ncbi:MAG: hypothetical protein GC145_18680 [Caulobacter sp.]|nr:hypothetical protein [Caulobacter sp.]